MAKSFFADANTAILVNNVAFADAISATNISQGEAPILYTQANRLLPETRAILQTIHPKQIGWQSLRQPHGTKTAGKPDAKHAQRFNGANRYEVAAKVASSYFSTAKVGMVASGEVFSDALVAAPLSQKLNAPILLVQKTNLGQSIEAYLKSNKAISLLHVLGGENTVASSVLTKLGEFGRPSNTTMPIVR